MKRQVAAWAAAICIGLAWQARAAETTTRPTGMAQRSFEYTIDTSETPELKEWADKLRPDIEKWYAIYVECLASDGYTAPKQFSITFRNMKGVAYTSGTRIVCAAAWFKAHPDDGGAIIHELVHVVQQYRSRTNPPWLVEGVADYMRWFHYEPVSKRPRLRNPDRASYTNSYQVTAGFIEFVAKNHNHEIAVRFNAAMRQGRYEPELWQEFTGKTVDELWAEYVKSVKGATTRPAN